MRFAFPAVFALAQAAVLAVSPAPAESLKIVADVPLSGPTGRFDYQSFGPTAHRLYISQMDAGSVVVFDSPTRREVAVLPGFPGATGILAVPGQHRVFVSITGRWWKALLGGGELAAIDAVSLKTVWRVPAGRFPDGIAFTPGLKRLFISDERGQQELVYDAINGHPITTIPLGGEVGMSVADPSSGRVFVNVQTKRQIAVINPESARIERRIALPEACSNNHGLLIDAGRAFVACDDSDNLLVVNLETARTTQILPVGEKPDVLTLDPVRDRLFVASESGVVSVFNVKPKKIEKLWEGLAGDNAHSIAVDPDSGLLYLPLRNLNGHPVLRIMEYQ